MANFRNRTIIKKRWERMLGGTLTVNLDTTNISTGFLTFSEAATILRVRMPYLSGQMIATIAVGDDLRLTFGLVVVLADAAELGATAVPDPLDEPEFPWLWWGETRMFATNAGVENQFGSQYQVLHPELKLMRKVKSRESLIWIVQSIAASGAPDVRVVILTSRVLVGT